MGVGGWGSGVAPWGKSWRHGPSSPGTRTGLGVWRKRRPAYRPCDHTQETQGSVLNVVSKTFSVSLLHASLLLKSTHSLFNVLIIIMFLQCCSCLFSGNIREPLPACSACPACCSLRPVTPTHSAAKADHVPREGQMPKVQADLQQPWGGRWDRIGESCSSQEGEAREGWGPPGAGCPHPQEGSGSCLAGCW